MFELGDGRGLLEVGEGVGVVDDVFAVEVVGGGGELVERGLPCGKDLACEVGDRCSVLQRCVGAGEGVEAGGDHQFEIALGEDDVGVLPVEDFALLGDAEFAGEAVHGLGEDGAVGGAAAAADGAAAAVEEAEVDAAVAGDLVEGAVGLVDLPGAGDHAAVFVGVGVAEHDLLMVVPTCKQRLVGFAGPELAHDGGGVLEVFDGLEERDGLKAGIVDSSVASGGVASTLTPPRRASQRTWRTSSALVAPLMTYWRMDSGE